MKIFIPRPILASFLLGVWAPAAALAQVPSVPGTTSSRKEREETRPPIPPGVPTTPDNVHLPTEGEVKLGRQSSVEVEKHYKVITSGPYHERLQRVSRTIVQSIQRSDVVQEYRRVYRLPKPDDTSRRVPFEFTFKVIDSTKEINAFSLAGGPIYATRGLMDYATSDDELAAVLAHECTHVAYHHVAQLVKKEKKAQTKQLFGLLAAVIAGAAGGAAVASAASNVLMASQLVQIATLSGYGRELETEADRVGVLALHGTPYNPVGMLTFMQKLARQDRLHGSQDYGIFQSHPYTNERVDTLKKQLVALGYSVDPGSLRKVSKTFRVEAVLQPMNGKAAAELRLNGSPFFTVVASDGAESPTQRAERMARQIETLFTENLTFNDVRQSPDKTTLLLKGIPVIRVLPEDAAVAGSASAATERAYNAILRALLKEKLDTP